MVFVLIGDGSSGRPTVHRSPLVSTRYPTINSTCTLYRRVEYLSAATLIRFVHAALRRTIHHLSPVPRANTSHSSINNPLKCGRRPPVSDASRKPKIIPPSPARPISLHLASYFRETTCCCAVPLSNHPLACALVRSRYF